MAQHYDVLVIGSGSAGYTVAAKCQEAGRRVGILESRELGGTCPNRGCNPKKVLTGAAQIIARARHMEGKGLTGESALAWDELASFAQSIIEPMPGIVERRLKDKGVSLHRGRARFVGDNRLRVGDAELTADQIFIGTGAIPRPLQMPGREHVINSEEFLKRRSLPQSLVFIGGGYISFEFAHAAARAGAKPIILQRSRPLKNFDPDLVDLLVEASAAIGIEVHSNTPVLAVEKSDDGFVLRAGENGEREFRTDLVIHGAGRVADVLDLDLDKAGVEASSKGIAVNEYLQSVSNPAVYAGGDAAATGYPLTPTAYLEGRVAARNMLNGNQEAIDHTGIPSVVFTYPPLAAVGWLESEAREQGLTVDVKFENTAKWFSAKSIGLEHAGFKLLTDNESGKILGAHILGNHAEEVINIIGLAMRLDLTTGDLKQAVWAYPTSVSDIAYLLD